MNGLLKSRKFWFAVFGVVQAVVLQYLAIPDAVWQTIAALAGTIIMSIAIEDAGLKAGGGTE
jgi:Na+/H+ antiporter NhaD/arsenite permease-like protein